MDYQLTFVEYLCAFMQIFIPYWNSEYTKVLPYTVVKVGGDIDPTTEVTKFG